MTTPDSHSHNHIGCEGLAAAAAAAAAENNCSQTSQDTQYASQRLCSAVLLCLVFVAPDPRQLLPRLIYGAGQSEKRHGERGAAQQNKRTCGSLLQVQRPDGLFF